MALIVAREDIAQFRTLISQRLGLYFDDNKAEFLADLLRDRSREAGCSSAAAYLTVLRHPADGRQELRVLTERLTVPETYFFRNRDHFRVLSEALVPQFRASRRLRVLSAGCATGDEPYTLAILMQQLALEQSWDIQITALDICPETLKRARRALYSPWALRDTDSEIKSRYFRAEGQNFQLDDSIRAMVSFEERNLAEDDPAFWHADAFDIVFCRNVVMYFVPEIAQRVITRIWRSLAPGGYLFLGHAETLRSLSCDFHLCHTHDTFYYQRREGEPGGVTLPARSERVPVPALPALGMDVSWVAAIQNASDRIAALTTPSRAVPIEAETPPVPVPARWDLAGTLELMRQERFADALESLQVLPAEAHADADARLLRAVLQMNAGKLDEAEQICSSLLEDDEMNAGAHYLAALCREHRGDRTAATEHDLAAIYLDAAFAMPHFHLGLMARRAGDAAAARQELGAALPLLLREDASRILLFGGGFSRDALVSLCRSELRAAGEVS